VVPVVLCGGEGTRLRPWSTPTRPKPLVHLPSGDETLLAATLRRLEAPGFAAPRLMAGRHHAPALSAAFPGVAMLVEERPAGTAAAVLMAALQAGEATLLVVPADHVIHDTEALHEAVRCALPAAAEGRVVVFGVRPTYAATGFGWITQGASVGPGVAAVDAFLEKPDPPTARALLLAGGHLWNAGMFLFHGPALVRLAAELTPELLRACQRAVAAATTDGATVHLAAPLPAGGPSFDVAVMERLPSDRAAVVALDVGWDDVGTWDAVGRVGSADASGNVLLGRVTQEGCRDSVVVSDGPAVMVSGLEGVVVAASPEGVVVLPRHDSERVKHLAWPGLERRPWGGFARLDRGPGYQVKRLVVSPGQRTSLQRHAHRSERWTVISGCATVHLDGNDLVLHRGEDVLVPLGAVHRLGNDGAEPLVVLELQTGVYLEEDDIERLSDDYGRVELSESE